MSLDHHINNQHQGNQPSSFQPRPFKSMNTLDTLLEAAAFLESLQEANSNTDVNKALLLNGVSPSSSTSSIANGLSIPNSTLHLHPSSLSSSPLLLSSSAPAAMGGMAEAAALASASIKGIRTNGPINGQPMHHLNHAQALNSSMELVLGPDGEGGRGGAHSPASSTSTLSSSSVISGRQPGGGGRGSPRGINSGDGNAASMTSGEIPKMDPNVAISVQFHTYSSVPAATHYVTGTSQSLGHIGPLATGVDALTAAAALQNGLNGLNGINGINGINVPVNYTLSTAPSSTSAAIATQSTNPINYPNINGVIVNNNTSIKNKGGRRSHVSESHSPTSNLDGVINLSIHGSGRPSSSGSGGRGSRGERSGSFGSASSQEKDPNSYSRHRELHKTLEKNRRAHLRQCFEILKEELPRSEYTDKKTSHINIIKCAIRYIQQLKRAECEYEHEIERLARAKIRFQNQLAQLKDDLLDAASDNSVNEDESLVITATAERMAIVERNEKTHVSPCAIMYSHD